MKQISNQVFYIFIPFLIYSCNETSEKNKANTIIETYHEKAKINPNEKFLAKHSDSCGCKSEYEFKDSLYLKHIKTQFYKSKTGHIYEKTIAIKEVLGQDTLVDVIYFNGTVSQDVDPITFEPLEGWYAKDKNNVYYYRPVSGGMILLKIEKADTKTFQILKGHYRYGQDKNNFYDETEIIKNFLPNKTTLKRDNKDRVSEMTCMKKRFKFEIVN